MLVSYRSRVFLFTWNHSTIQTREAGFRKNNDTGDLFKQHKINENQTLSVTDIVFTLQIVTRIRGLWALTICLVSCQLGAVRFILNSHMATS